MSSLVLMVAMRIAAFVFPGDLVCAEAGLFYRGYISVPCKPQDRIRHVATDKVELGMAACFYPCFSSPT
jgi:hypothetical protein